mgnify:CR=1 FL=1
MKTNQDYKDAALAALKGHWGPAVLFAFVFFSYLGTSLANPLLFGYFVVMIIAMLQEVIRPNNQTICISFHVAEHPMKYPYKKERK